MEEEVRPPIVITDTDKPQLYKLAKSALNKMPRVADELLIELERAAVSPDPAVPGNVVRMKSYVRFVTDKGTEHVLQLVYPEDADIIRGRLSILSPIGTALIGLSEGHTMVWTDREGARRTLTVIEVSRQQIY